jgi:hypothetical protein
MAAYSVRARTPLISVFILAILILQAAAGLQLKYRHTTDPYEMMGQKVPASTNVITTTVSGEKARVDQGKDTSIIIDNKSDMVYLLDHKHKRYLAFNLGEAKSQMDQAMGELQGQGEQSAQMAAMMQGMMQFKAEVKGTSKKKKIGKWNCRKYNVSMNVAMSRTASEIWATTDIQIDPAFYQKIRNSTMLNMPGVKDMLKEFEKIKGVTVLSISSSTVMGSAVKSKEELLEIRKTKIPAKTFSVPDGYKKAKN